MSGCRSFIAISGKQWPSAQHCSRALVRTPNPSRRSFATQAAGAPRFQVFNRQAKWLQKERAARNVEASRQADYLKDEIASRLVERLLVRARLVHEQLRGTNTRIG